MVAIMEEHHPVRPARLAVGLQQQLELADQRIGGRQRVARGACRTRGGAGAAAGADFRVDGDMIAVRRDGACRAKVEAAGAARHLRARMGAEIGLEVDVARFVERADEVGGVVDRALHGCRVARVGTKVAGAQIVSGEKRRAACQVQNDIAFRHGPVSRGAESQGCARRRRGQGEIVDGQLKAAKAAGRGANDALEDRKHEVAGRRHVLRPREDDRHVEAVRKPFGSLDGLLVAAIDEGDALALDGNEPDRRHRFGCRRDKRRHFRGGVRPFLGPAGRFANVHVGDVGGFAGVFPGLSKQGRLRRAGDGDVARLAERRPHTVQLGAAELAAAHGLAAAGLAHGVEIDVHGAFAVTDENRAAFARHFSPSGPFCGP